MKFIVSDRFKDRHRIKRLGVEYFNKLPNWAKFNAHSHSTVIIGINSNDTERVFRKNKQLINGGGVVQFVLNGNIERGYCDIFADYLKSVFRDSPVVQEEFMKYVRDIYVSGCSMKDITDNLCIHLASTYITPENFRRYNPERFRLCVDIARSLDFVTSPCGTLQ